MLIFKIQDSVGETTALEKSCLRVSLNFQVANIKALKKCLPLNLHFKTVFFSAYREMLLWLILPNSEMLSYLLVMGCKCT